MDRAQQMRWLAGFDQDIGYTEGGEFIAPTDFVEAAGGDDRDAVGEICGAGCRRCYFLGRAETTLPSRLPVKVFERR